MVHGGGQFNFELSVDQIPAGWTTIRLDNQTEATHFDGRFRIVCLYPERQGDRTTEGKERS